MLVILFYGYKIRSKGWETLRIPRPTIVLAPLFVCHTKPFFHDFVLCGCRSGCSHIDRGLLLLASKILFFCQIGKLVENQRPPGSFVKFFHGKKVR